MEVWLRDFSTWARRRDLIAEGKNMKHLSRAAANVIAGDLLHRDLEGTSTGQMVGERV